MCSAAPMSPSNPPTTVCPPTSWSACWASACSARWLKTSPSGSRIWRPDMAIDGQASPDELARLVRTVRLIAFDFDGVFTDNAVYVFEDGREAVRCSRADGLGLRKLNQHGLASLILSTEV